MTECPQELIDAHWGYIESMLAIHGVGPDSMKLVGFHYRTAFAHGWKHAKEEEVFVKLDGTVIRVQE